MTGRTRVAIAGGVATLASSAALIPVFQGLDWLLPVAFGIALVVICNELVRRSPLPAAIGPLVAAGAVLCQLTNLYASRSAFWHVVPTTTSLRELGSVVRAGFSDIRHLAPPVPPHPGLVLIAVVGVAAVALVVDLLAVTLRRAALAGLPLLAVFATGTSVATHGAGGIAFAIATTGYLYLLVTDSRDRLSRWGRSLGFDRATRPRFSWSEDDALPSPLAVMGRRIGVAAVAIGLVTPMLVPGLRGGVPHGGHGLGFGHGGSSTVFAFNPIVGIRAQLNSAKPVQLFTLQTDDPDPSYLRLTSLDQFDGTTFSPSTLQQGVEAQVSRGIAAPAVQGRPVHVSVSVGSLHVRWLPLPVQVEKVDVSGDWRYDGRTNTVFSARAFTDNLNYSALVVHPAPTSVGLEQAGPPETALNRYLQVPNVPGDVVDLTNRVIAGAPTPFDKAVALERFFHHAPFEYNTSIPVDNSSNALADFLLHTHAGFCQQYATAMAVMARIAGIPSRVAVGFTHGQLRKGKWVVTTKDAHAWPELYFTGYGWVPFEPTPRGDGQAIEPSYAVPNTANGNGSGRNNGQDGGNSGATQKTGPLGLKFTRDENHKVPGIGILAPQHHTQVSHRTIAFEVLLGLLLLLLLLPSVVRVIGRRRRWAAATSSADRAAAAWAELRATAIDARIGWIDGLSPRATARVLRTDAAGFTSTEAQALTRIVDAVQRAAYSANPGAGDGIALRDDVEELRSALFADATPGERFMLRAWPRSTVRDARVVVSRFVELLDVLDLRAARMKSRVRHRHAT